MVLRKLNRRVRGIFGTTSFTGALALPATANLPDGPRSTQASFKELCDTYDMYRYNTVFEELGASAFDIVTSMSKEDLTLRGIYNPVPVIVDFYQNHVLSGRMVPPPAHHEAGQVIDPDTALPEGDLWVETSNDSLIQPILDLWSWSNMQLRLPEAAGNAATYGNCLLLVNATEDNKVFVEVAHPAALTSYQRDIRGHYNYAQVTTQETELDPNGRVLTYTLVREYYKDSFLTYRSDDKSSAIQTPNPYGFVPVVMMRHKPVTDSDWGLNAFYQILSDIHELNVSASVLGSNILMHQKPRWVVFGSAAPDDSPAAADDMWFFPTGSDIKTMIPSVDIAGTYTHISNILEYMETICPELLLPKVGDKKRDVSGAAVRGIMAGLIRRALTARENYEHALKDITRMALSIGQSLGTWQIDGSFEDGGFDFEFHWPDILPLNRLERLRINAEEKQLELQIATLQAQLDMAIQYGPEFLITGVIPGTDPTGGLPPGGTGAGGANTIPPPAPSPDVAPQNSQKEAQ